MKKKKKIKSKKTFIKPPVEFKYNTITIIHDFLPDNNTFGITGIRNLPQCPSRTFPNVIAIASYPPDYFIWYNFLEFIKSRENDFFEKE